MLQNGGQGIRFLCAGRAGGVVDEYLAILRHAAQHDVVPVLGESARPHVGDHGMPAQQRLDNLLAVLSDPLAGHAAQLAHRADRAMIEALAVVVAVFIGPLEQQVRCGLGVAGQVVDHHAHGGRAAAGGGRGLVLAVDPTDGFLVVVLIDLRDLHRAAGETGPAGRHGDVIRIVVEVGVCQGNILQEVVARRGGDIRPVVAAVAQALADEVAPEGVILIAHDLLQELDLLLGEVVLLHHVHVAQALAQHIGGGLAVLRFPLHGDLVHIPEHRAQLLQLCLAQIHHVHGVVLAHGDVDGEYAQHIDPVHRLDVALKVALDQYGNIVSAPGLALDLVDIFRVDVGDGLGQRVGIGVLDSVRMGEDAEWRRENGRAHQNDHYNHHDYSSSRGDCVDERLPCGLHGAQGRLRGLPQSLRGAFGGFPGQFLHVAGHALGGFVRHLLLCGLGSGVDCLSRGFPADIRRLDFHAGRAFDYAAANHRLM